MITSTFDGPNYTSTTCLQVPPTLGLPLSDDVPDRQNENTTIAAGTIAALAAEVATPIIPAPVRHTVSELSILSAERTAALHYILSSPNSAPFRDLQSDLRSSRVITTPCTAVILNDLLDIRVARMRSVRDHALTKLAEEREAEREDDRRMGLGKGLGWFAGLTSVANLGGFLKQSSSDDVVKTNGEPPAIRLRGFKTTSSSGKTTPNQSSVAEISEGTTKSPSSVGARGRSVVARGA